MKKAFLYLFFFGMLFFKSGSVFSLEYNPNNTIEKIQNLNFIITESSQNIPSKIKIDCINYFENENEEYNSHTSLINKKILNINKSYCNDYLGTINFVFKIANSKTYFIENCSYIPRYSFLFLRVLRL